MDGVGERLRARAKQLGLSDIEVARRLGLSQSRYANSVAGKREPDFATLVRICRILAVTPDSLFGFNEPATAGGERSTLLDGVLAAAESMSLSRLRLAADVMRVLASDTEAGSPPPE